MPDVQNDIDAFTRQQLELEREYTGKWALFHNGELVSLFETFEHAAEEAVRKFGRGPYLIRQVGASTTAVLPASVMFRPIHA